MTDALVLREDLSLALEQRVLSSTPLGSALIAVEYAGICGSDLHVLNTGDWVTTWPAILGHEIIGIVEDCPGGEFSTGDRVVVDSRVPCNGCLGCQTAANLCENLAWVGEIVPGGYQRHTVLDVGLLHLCPPELDARVGVLAEPLAVAMHGVSRLREIPPAALILGYGPIGALVHSELSRLRPDCVITVREPNSDRRQLAEACGATLTSESTRWPLVVDAAGYATSISDAIDLTAHGGSILAIAIPHTSTQIDAQGLVERSISLIGSVGFNDELAQAITSLNDNPDHYRALVTEEVPLALAADRLRTMPTRPAAGKVVIQLVDR